jgi:hypothetical protein
MKILHFVEATGTDEFAFPADRVNTITVENDQAIRIWFSNSDGQTNDSRIDITGITPADSAEEAADYFAGLIAPGSKSGIYSFTELQQLPIKGTNAAGATVSPVLTTIAYTVGA